MEGRSPVEAELVERARGGDVAAFEALVRAHQEIAIRTAWIISGGADDAEDAAQEGFVKAFGALARFKPGAPFRPWLLTIVANEARNRRRSAGRRRLWRCASPRTARRTARLRRPSRRSWPMSVARPF